MASSSYFESLETKAKKRYCEKLSCVGLSIHDDPYSPRNDGRFANDMASWPQIEFGHIFGYFIKRPGTYTQEQLLSWKQLDAFNFFQSGYVRTVLSFVFGFAGKSFVLLKAKVNPSQKTPDGAHEPWLISKTNGEIICAHCTCMAR